MQNKKYRKTLYRRLDPMRDLISGVFPFFDLFKISSNVDEFTVWLKQEHRKEINTEILHGHKFFLECFYSSIIYALHGDESLGMKTDFLLDHSGKDTIYLGKLPNSCQKIVFLKNILHHFRPIQKANSVDELKQAIKNFEDNVIKFFDKLYTNCIKHKPHARFSLEKLKNLQMLEVVYIYFSQVNNNGPAAYMGRLMKHFWIPEKKLNNAFHGYVLVLQFTWRKLLGDKQYLNSCLSEMHKTKTWQGIVYDDPIPDENDLAALINRTFKTERQTSLYAFQYRIRDEFMYPFEKKNKISILGAEDYFRSNKKKYSKRIFNKLLNSEFAKEEPVSLEEELDMLLYWFPMEIADSRTENSVGAFNTMLHGAVSLMSEKGKEFEKIIVCKFTHPREDLGNGNDYSYGVLVDMVAAAGHYSSQWFLYYDCCGDYSGASGREHKKIEDFLEKFKRKGIIELRERNIGHEEFKKYISKYISRSFEDSNISPEQVEEQLEKISIERRESYIISTSQGLLVELISYYLASQKKKYLRKYKEVNWNRNSPSKAQIDLIMTNDTDVHIIECKLNPHTLNFDKEIQILNNKLNSFTDKINKSCEFWFWHEPNEKQRQILLTKNIQYFSLQEFANDMPTTLKDVFNYKYNNKK